LAEGRIIRPFIGFLDKLKEVGEILVIGGVASLLEWAHSFSPFN